MQKQLERNRVKSVFVAIKNILGLQFISYLEYCKKDGLFSFLCIHSMKIVLQGLICKLFSLECEVRIHELVTC